MADKSGLRKKSKSGSGYKKPSKYTDQDLIEMNRNAGRKFRARLIEEGNLTPKEVADLIRKDINK